MFFVFGALLEFAIVNSYMRKTEKFDQMAKKIIAQGNSGRSKKFEEEKSIALVIHD